MTDAEALAAALGPHGVAELLQLLQTARRPGTVVVEFDLGVGPYVDLQTTVKRKVLDPRRKGA